MGPKPVLTGALTERQPYEDKRHIGTSCDHEGRYKQREDDQETTQSQEEARKDPPLESSEGEWPPLHFAFSLRDFRIIRE